MLNPDLFQPLPQQEGAYIYDDGDRGPAEFFHGHKDIRARFHRVLATAHAKKAGTTFLVQGAPGAGKSALLHQMCTESEGWVLANIGGPELWNPVAMAQALGKSYTVTRTISGGVEIKVFSGGVDKEVAGFATSGEVLRRQAPPTGVILVFDEAQTLPKISAHVEMEATATLNAIHNGLLGAPVVLLTAGLGTTKIAYKQMGVSQFKRGCVHQIEALGLQAQQAVIRDWLTIAGGAKGDVDPWIDAITEKSHGWPQHMICYALCAKDVLDQTGGEMSSAALEEVLAFGDHDRAAYYAGRVDGLKQSDIVRIAQVFSGVGPSEHMSKEDIIDSLQYGQDQACAEKLFEDLLHRGVIAHTTVGMYQSPIPSFHKWIVQNFGKDLGKG